LISVLLGTAAALCWGVQNVLLAGVARKGDPGAASFWYVAYMALLALPFAIFTWDPSSLEGDAAGYLVLAGVVQGLGMLFFTRALAIGPIGMLTGLLSLEGAGAAILSFVAGEAIGGPVAAGLLLCSAGGVLLVAARAEDVPGRSVGLTMFAVLCNAVGLFSLGYYEVDLALTMVIFNGSSAAVILGLLKVQGGNPRVTEGHFESVRSEALPVMISALGLLGLVAFAYGSREGSTAVTAVLAAQFAGVAAIGGYFQFHEKMEPRQLIGFGILVCGVSLIAAFA